MLCETKSILPSSPVCLSRTGFAHFECIPTQGLAGGIWLLWKDDVVCPFNLVTLVVFPRFIACKLTLLNSGLNVYYFVHLCSCS